MTTPCSSQPRLIVRSCAPEAALGLTIGAATASDGANALGIQPRHPMPWFPTDERDRVPRATPTMAHFERTWRLGELGGDIAPTRL